MVKKIIVLCCVLGLSEKANIYAAEAGQATGFAVAQGSRIPPLPSSLPAQDRVRSIIPTWPLAPGNGQPPVQTTMQVDKRTELGSSFHLLTSAPADRNLTGAQDFEMTISPARTHGDQSERGYKRSRGDAEFAEDVTLLLGLRAGVAGQPQRGLTYAYWESECKRLQEEIGILKRRIQGLDGGSTIDRLEQLSNVYQEQLTRVQEKLQEARAYRAKLELQVATTEDEKQAIARDLAQQQALLVFAQSEIVRLQSAVARSEQQSKTRLTALEKEKAQEITGLKDELQRAQINLENMQRGVGEKDARIQSLQAELQNVQPRTQSVGQSGKIAADPRVTPLLSEIAELRTENQKCRDSIAEKNTEIGRLRNSIQELEWAQARCNREMQTVRNDSEAQIASSEQWHAQAIAQVQRTHAKETEQLQRELGNVKKQQADAEERFLKKDEELMAMRQLIVAQEHMQQKMTEELHAYKTQLEQELIKRLHDFKLQAQQKQEAIRQECDDLLEQQHAQLEVEYQQRLHRKHNQCQQLLDQEKEKMQQELVDKCEEYNKNILGVHSDLEQVQAELAAKNQELGVVKAALKTAQKSEISAQITNEGLQIEITQRKDRSAQLEREKNKLQQQLDRLQEQLSELQQRQEREAVRPAQSVNIASSAPMSRVPAHSFAASATVHSLPGVPTPASQVGSLPPVVALSMQPTQKQYEGGAAVGSGSAISLLSSDDESTTPVTPPVTRRRSGAVQDAFQGSPSRPGAGGGDDDGLPLDEGEFEDSESEGSDVSRADDSDEDEVELPQLVVSPQPINPIFTALKEHYEFIQSSPMGFTNYELNKKMYSDMLLAKIRPLLGTPLLGKPSDIKTLNEAQGTFRQLYNDDVAIKMIADMQKLCKNLLDSNNTSGV